MMKANVVLSSTRGYERLGWMGGFLCNVQRGNITDRFKEYKHY